MGRDDTTELFSAEPAEEVRPDPATPETPAPARPAAEELLPALERLEHALDGLRRSFDATVRERRHREMSAARLIGALLQAVVLGLVLWALSDWVFEEPAERLFIKLAFAAVLQMGAVSAFLLGREGD